MDPIMQEEMDAEFNAQFDDVRERFASTAADANAAAEQDMDEEHENIITDPAAAKAYIFSGNATFTLKSLKTDKRYTFKVKAKSKRTDAGGWTKEYDEPMRFVSLLTAPDHYEYLGLAFVGQPWLTAGKKGNPNHPAFKALDWTLTQANVRANTGKAMPEELEMWHEGQCGRCGRQLTDPVSIARGIGPECATKV